METITQQEATQIAMSVLRSKNIPFRELSAVGKLVPDQDSANESRWRISFDIPMPLGMQDEFFTVEINAVSGRTMGIITPTRVIV